MRISFGFNLALFCGFASLFIAPAHALELDWSGQFRAEANFVHDYSLTGASLPTAPQSGYSINPGGSEDAHFQTLFLRLKPKVIVNDNVVLKTEVWFGDPVYGMFGNSAPYTPDQRQYYSNQSRGATVSAQRFWGEFMSDLGTVQVGRAPLQWGLGILWNNGDGLWDRYQSTGDLVRLISKFGAFTFSPAVIKYDLGNSIGGACTPTFDATGTYTGCGPQTGGAGVTDYSLIFKYDNSDEEFEFGLNFVRRIAGAAQDSAGYLGVGSQQGAGMSYNTWDLFGRKKWGKFSLAGEVPITTGEIGGLNYKTFAVALEANLDISDSWLTGLKAGHAPGQPNFTGSAPDQYQAFYFNPNYKIALIMFNYQLANFAAPTALNNPGLNASSLRSPYDNPIEDANYLSWSLGFKADKWDFHTAFTYANAPDAATTGQAFLNNVSRTFVNNAASDQGHSLGFEMDYGTTFKWDDNLIVGGDIGWWFPGNFYKFSDIAGIDNSTNSVFAATARIGVTF